MPEDVHRESIGDSYVEHNDDGGNAAQAEENDPDGEDDVADALQGDISLPLGHFGHLQ